MICIQDGIVPIPTPTPRQLVTQTDETLAGSAQTILIDYTVLFELQMEQWTAHVNAVPGTVLNGEINLYYIHRTEVRQDTLLLSVNFAQDLIQDLACLRPFRWKPGDHVRVTYANVDDLSVGTQFMGIEVIL